MYTHKATTPGDDRAEFERTVYFKGKLIGRIHQFTFGPQKGQYWWTLEWMTGNNSGVVDTMEKALSVVKNRHMNAN